MFYSDLNIFGLPGISPINEVSSSTEFKTSLNDVVDECKSDKEIKKFPHPPKERRKRVKGETEVTKKSPTPPSITKECPNTTPDRPQTTKQRTGGNEQKDKITSDGQDDINTTKLLKILPSTIVNSPLHHIKTLLKKLYRMSDEMIVLTANFRSSEEKQNVQIIDDLLYVISCTDNANHVVNGIRYLQQR